MQYGDYQWLLLMKIDRDISVMITDDYFIIRLNLVNEKNAPKIWQISAVARTGCPRIDDNSFDV